MKCLESRPGSEALDSRATRSTRCLRSRVGNGEVLLAVAVEVPDGHRGGFTADGEVDRGGETARALSQQDRHVAGPELATARSCLPSPLKSPTATDRGALRAEGGAALKAPAPLPRKIATLFEPSLATTRSCLPSPLKSPTATDTGSCRRQKLRGAGSRRAIAQEDRHVVR